MVELLCWDLVRLSKITGVRSRAGTGSDIRSMLAQISLQQWVCCDTFILTCIYPSLFLFFHSHLRLYESALAPSRQRP